MPDLPEACQMAHRVDDIVRCLAFWLVDHQRTVKRRRTRLSWHAWEFPCAAFRIEAKECCAGLKPSAYNAGCDLLWRCWLVFLHFFQQLFDALDVFLREVERKVHVRQS